MIAARQLAAAAQDLVGCPFRLHGRHPETGLDCIGLLDAALTRIGRTAGLPSGYPLRLRRLEGWMPAPEALGFTAASGPFEPGDVVMLAPGPAQFHLAIAGHGGSWIHAHAGLRRVTEQPALPAGALVHHWRLAPTC